MKQTEHKTRLGILNEGKWALHLAQKQTPLKAVALHGYTHTIDWAVHS